MGPDGRRPEEVEGMTKHVIAPGAYVGGEKRGGERYGSGDTVTVRDGVMWIGDEVALQGMASGGRLRDLDVKVFGVVVGRSAGLDLGSQVDEVRGSEIVVGAPGAVAGLEEGIVLRGGTGNEIVNRGEILATQAAIRAGGDDLVIRNDGLIATFGDYYEEAPLYHAISITHGDARIVNGGEIYGFDGGLKPWDQAAIKAAKGARLDLRNEAEGVIGYDYGSTAIMGGESGDAIVNDGIVWGAIDTRGGDDLVRIEGQVFGRIDLGEGDDRLVATGEGTALTTIAGGSGDDIYEIFPDLNTEIVELRGGGRDTVIAHDSYVAHANVERIVLASEASGERLMAAGNGLDNVVEGGRGRDILDGMAGNDLVKGRSGDDVLVGGVGRDRLFGGSGADDLFGGSGSDTLKGGRGDDRLMGGAGGDRLGGGGGADTFVWTSTDDAGTGRGERDVVLRFRPGRDELDFRDLDLSFRDGRFSGDGAEIRVTEKKGHSFLRIDADGDGDSDMTIILRGVTGLGEDDLML